jgi:hypothetical protein
MQEEFDTLIQGRTYLLKRLYVADYPLTYHVHVDLRFRHLVFRMQFSRGKWRIIHQDLPYFAWNAEAALGEEISFNERMVKAAEAA